ncbi:MAG: hypothetical protein A3F74_16520 [Betaproteobacteria bacterium RIFCSPLOWO2_12_FULL_62_58]|nr:MAG: hypothetical protein A3F74_16520 [Betaproteobacteria bacterium RIFCSPLOWO2_12_FULL_62_58]
MVGLAGCDKTPDLAEKFGRARQPDQVESFLQGYWARPLSAQGTPPAQFSVLEASIDPHSCGTCHVAQFDDWKKSLHSQAMGPGILGQLVDMSPDATQEHQDCIRCHAPLKEQADSLAASLARKEAYTSRPAKDIGSALHDQGLICTACHMREYQRYGPPRKDGSTLDPTAQLPHNGWISNAAFEDSRFCAACHQFTKDEYALNGKLLENTYEEWKASRYAREGRTCQSCHMPERRHLWRGIHDPEMVRSGVTIDATPAAIQSGMVSAALTIKNTGTGHHFPTYVTPRVVVEAYQEGADRQMLKGTLREYIIGRQVSLDLSKEIADTRIAPDEQAVFDYRAPLKTGAVALVFRVRVEPDAFYTGFYRSLLEGNQAGKGEHLIKQALENSLASQFAFYTARRTLLK